MRYIVCRKSEIHGKLGTRAAYVLYVVSSNLDQMNPDMMAQAIFLRLDKKIFGTSDQMLKEYEHAHDGRIGIMLTEHPAEHILPELSGSVVVDEKYFTFSEATAKKIRSECVNFCGCNLCCSLEVIDYDSLVVASLVSDANGYNTGSGEENK